MEAKPAGFFTKMGIDEYHSFKDVVHSGRLFSAHKSSFAHAVVPIQDSPALQFGRDFHDIMSGSQFVCLPKMDRRTKEGKAAYAAFLKKSKGKIVLDKSTYDQMMGMYVSINQHKAARELTALPGTDEVSIFWQDHDNDVLCACRPDRLVTEDIIIDYKTTRSASPSDFPRSCLQYGYHVQAAWYLRGVNAVSGNALKHGYYTRFIFIAVEKTPPYAVAVWEAPQSMIKAGQQIIEKVLPKYAKCVKENKYPGYSQEIQVIPFPKY